MKAESFIVPGSFLYIEGGVKMVSTYTQLCPVLFGPDASKQLGEKAKEMGAKNVMLIYDKGIGGTGIVDAFEKDLEENGMKVLRFDGVMPDAPKEMVNAAGKLAQDNNIDAIVGIGGGSSLDTAKAISILIENPLPIEDYYPHKGKAFKQERPLILVPTAAGTGSEVTIMAVIHDKDTDAKEFVLRHGDLAILDPCLTMSAPPFVTASTGMDAMSHAAEALTTNCGNPKADLLALHAIKLITDNLPVAFQDGNDLEARTNLSLASNFAGMAFNDASVHFGHAAAHELGVQFHMPHGDACAIALPEVIRFSADIIPEKTANIAEALGIAVPEGAGGAEIGELCAAKIRSLMKEVGIKSLKERGLSREEVVACAEGAVKKNWFVICSLKEITPEVMAEELGEMYDNYQ